MRATAMRVNGKVLKDEHDDVKWQPLHVVVVVGVSDFFIVVL